MPTTHRLPTQNNTQASIPLKKDRLWKGTKTRREVEFLFGSSSFLWRDSDVYYPSTIISPHLAVAIFQVFWIRFYHIVHISAVHSTIDEIA